MLQAPMIDKHLETFSHKVVLLKLKNKNKCHNNLFMDKFVLDERALLKYVIRLWSYMRTVLYLSHNQKNHIQPQTPW